MRRESLWAAVLPQARWFQGKGLPWRGLELHPLPWYGGTPAMRIRSELAVVDLGGVTQTYHLLVGYAPPGTAEPGAVIGRATLDGSDEWDVVDAPRSGVAMRVFVEAIARPGVPGITWYGAPPPADAPASVLSGEQSHTSVRLGASMLLKIYRRLTDGPSLEVGVLADLARHVDPADAAGPITPDLIGRWSTPDGTRDLGFFCELVPDARDGYEFAVAALAAGEPLEEPMRALGATLARLHHQLRELYGARTAPAAELVGAVRERVRQAARETPALADLQDGLLARLVAPPGDMPLQRVHGDFHLGQALLGARGWVVIDFEGEPLKTPDERRVPDSPWRDVAGLLRSLDYVRHTHPDPDGPEARAWLAAARAGFLGGYLGTGAVSMPGLLQAYEIDKAVYEFGYETRNRPGWAATPLGALREAAGRPVSPR
ncbi:MAG: phosphotransferase [Actinomycetia bacterium]|nr:phosphotransferase [Actinomycetes bacterium]